MDATPLTRRRSLRVRGLSPEPLPITTPSRNKTARVIPPINDHELQPGGRHDDDSVSVKSDATVKSNASVRSARSTTSSARLRLLETERAAMKEVQRIDEQLLLRQKEAILKDLELAREIAAAEEEEARVHDELLQIPATVHFEPEPAAATTNRNAIVNNWLNNEPLQQAENPYAGQSKLEQMNDHMEKLLARQTVPRDLSQFSGQPEEWLGFISQFNETTKICGLSKQENMARLNKCLTGRARDAVAPILGLPDNVPLVIQTLQMMFGRPTQIVRSMLEKTTSLSHVNESQPDTIICFASSVNNLVTTMKNFDLTGYLNDPTLMDELLSKLPPGMQLQWCLNGKSNNDGRLTEFASWMMELAQAATFMPIPTKSCPVEKDLRTTRRQVFTTTTTPDSGCPRCQSDDHTLTKCSAFQHDSTEDRWDFVANKKLCFSCLKGGHRTSQCTQKRECGVQGCKQPHNSLLHRPSFPGFAK